MISLFSMFSRKPKNGVNEMSDFTKWRNKFEAEHAKLFNFLNEAQSALNALSAHANQLAGLIHTLDEATLGLSPAIVTADKIAGAAVPVIVDVAAGLNVTDTGAALESAKKIWGDILAGEKIVSPWEATAAKKDYQAALNEHALAKSQAVKNGAN